MMTRSILLVSLPAILCVGDAAAQTAARFEVVPHVGYYRPMNELGTAASAGGPWFLRLGRIEPSATVELAASVRWPAAPVSTRVLGFAALPSSASGTFTCEAVACPDILLRGDADVAVWAAVADFVIAPLAADRPVRPFIALGAGIKSYHFEWAQPIDWLDAGQHTDTGLALHAGLGLELDIAGAPLRLELSDYWSPEGARLEGEGTRPGVQPRRAAQHDLGVTLGWRLLRF